MKRIVLLLAVLSVIASARAAHDFIMPDSLRPGDKVAVCSPSYSIGAADVDMACRRMEAEGWVPVVMPHALDAHGHYAGTDANRLADLRSALLDPEIKAIVCARGGYGAIHLLQALDSLYFRIEPKWLVGFSDVTALHALMHRFGYMSIHGPMPVTFDADEESTQLLFDMLKGQPQSLTASPHRFNRCGVAEGTLVGGNFAVMAHLLGTPYDVIHPGSILFIEDVGEPVYKIERLFYQLRFSGVLEELGGLIVGEFSDYKHDPAYASMESMIRSMVEPYGYPVAFGVPIGHGKINHPVIESAPVRLTVAADTTHVDYLF